MLRFNEQVGIGNIFIFISQVDDTFPVSDSLLGGFRGKYLTFKNLNIVKDDPNVPAKCPPIYINPHTSTYVHPLCRYKVEPSRTLSTLLDEYMHLVKGVTAGLAIRFGNTRVSEGDTVPFIDEHGLSVFHNIIGISNGPVFVACDSLDYKRKLTELYGPEKVRYIEGDCVITHTANTTDSPTPYLEFFLLGMCPVVIGTGGPKDMSAFSTFGYMAAQWGQKPFEAVFNAT